MGDLNIFTLRARRRQDCKLRRFWEEQAKLLRPAWKKVASEDGPNVGEHPSFEVPSSVVKIAESLWSTFSLTTPWRRNMFGTAVMIISLQQSTLRTPYGRVFRMWKR